MSGEIGHRSETIKQRSIYIYLPSLEMVEDWKKRADAEKTSISKFVIRKVLDSIASGEQLEEVRRQAREALEENAKLTQENAMLKRLSDNLERELKKLRNQPFIEAGFTGTRKFDRDLIDLLKRGHGVDRDMIFARLHIDPTDVETIKGVGKQLEALQAYDLLEYNGRWYRWKG
jgi:regulator of replication initiation timing